MEVTAKQIAEAVESIIQAEAVEAVVYASPGSPEGIVRWERDELLGTHVWRVTGRGSIALFFGDYLFSRPEAEASFSNRTRKMRLPVLAHYTPADFEAAAAWATPGLPLRDPIHDPDVDEDVC